MGSQTPKLALPYPVGTDLIADGDNAIQALAERVEALWAAAWTAPAFLNGWANHAAGDPVGYRQVGASCQMRGLGVGTIGQVAFVLPANLRPTKDRYIASASNNLFGLVIVYAATGNVTPAVGSATWFSFDVTFGL